MLNLCTVFINSIDNFAAYYHRLALPGGFKEMFKHKRCCTFGYRILPKLAQADSSFT